MQKKIILTILCLSLFFGLAACGADSPVPPEIESTPAPTIREEIPEETTVPTEAPLSVTGIYHMDVQSDEEGAPIANRIELKHAGDSLFVFLTFFNEDGEWPLSAHNITARTDNGVVTAAYDYGYDQLELSCDGKTLDARHLWNGEIDSFTGHYQRLEISTEDDYPLPEFPEPVNDPNSPNGAIDKDLAAAAREYLGLPNDAVLTEEACANIPMLQVFDKKLVSLNGIEYFSNLQSIQVTSSYLRDISPLAKLDSITEISIGWSYIQTIPDLSNCKNLYHLDLTCNAITDISPVTRIPSLEWLELRGNYITSIAPIQDLQNLQSLSINDNPVLDWDCIKDNPALIRALDFDYDIALSVIARAEQILQETITEDMTDLEKEVAIYQKIHQIAESKSVNNRPERPYGYYVLMKGYGVCGDFSDAVSLLMNMAGLHCISCYSETHAWNMIELDGKWYELDCLWDIGNEPIYWTHFNISRKKMGQLTDHKTDTLRYPPTKHNMPKPEYLMLLAEFN